MINYNEIELFCINKFEFLYEFINSSENTQGIKGVCAKNGQFNKFYERKVRYTPDPRHFFWNSYIKNRVLKSDIKIYVLKPGGKLLYLVFADKIYEFLKAFPEGVVKKD